MSTQEIENKNTIIDSNETIVPIENENELGSNNSIVKEKKDIEKTLKKKNHLILKIILGLISLIIIVLIVICIIYLSTYSHATKNALQFMQSDNDVKVNKIDSGYFFDGPGTDKALIFYPGGKVDETAYSEILNGLSKNGIDCYLVKMPFHLAIFGKNKADKIINENKELYDKWYIAGHSLGGAMAAYYASSHSDTIDGLALLAAYSTKPIADNVKVVTVLGTNDKVLNWDTYNNNKKNLPNNFTEVKIEGGNHGQFGDYGEQKGDGKATIPLLEQHNKTVSAILDAFN